MEIESASEHKVSNGTPKGGVKRGRDDTSKSKNLTNIESRLTQHSTFFGNSLTQSGEKKEKLKRKQTESTVPEVTKKSTTKKQKVEKKAPVTKHIDEEEESTHDSDDEEPGLLQTLLISSKNGETDLDTVRQKLHERIEKMKKDRNADKSKYKKQQRQIQKAETPEKAQKTKKAKVTKQEESDDEEDSDNESPVNSRNSTPKKKNDISLDEMDIKYSTFEMDSGKPIPSYLVKKKKSKEQLLKEAQEKKALLQKKPELEQTLAYDSALKKARGERVFDNVKSIKNSIKFDAKKKQKSASEWAKRKADLDKQMKEKQKLRTKNIKEHIQKRKENKQKQLKKKNRPGFEGKKR